MGPLLDRQKVGTLRAHGPDIPPASACEKRSKPNPSLSRTILFTQCRNRALSGFRVRGYGCNVASDSHNLEVIPLECAQRRTDRRCLIFHPAMIGTTDHQLIAQSKTCVVSAVRIDSI